MEHVAGLVIEVGPNVVVLAELYLIGALVLGSAFLLTILWVNRR